MSVCPVCLGTNVACRACQGSGHQCDLPYVHTRENRSLFRCDECGMNYQVCLTESGLWKAWCPLTRFQAFLTKKGIRR